MSRAIVTVGVHPSRGFGRYIERFRRTMSLWGDADEVVAWDTQWPPGSPTHEQVHYGFKVYAIAEMLRRGHDSVLWVDCSGYAIQSVEPLWTEIESAGYFLPGRPALVDGFAPSDWKEPFDSLGEWSSDKALTAFRLTRDQAMRIPLLPGSCFGFSSHSRSIKGMAWFETLKRYAELPGHFNGTHASGLLGRPAATEGEQMSTDPRCKGHRSDEVYMTLIARDLGLRSSGEFFAGGMPPMPSAVIRSGYNL